MLAIRKATSEELEYLLEALCADRHHIPLREDQLRRFTALARMCEVPQGEVVVRQGDAPDYLYYIVSGQLAALKQTETGEARLLNYHMEHTFVGEHGMLTGEPRTATLVATAPAVLACWDQAAVDWLLLRNEQIRPYFERLYAARMQRAVRSFPGKQPDETLVFESRKHWLLLVNTLVAGAALLTILAVLWLVASDNLAPGLPLSLAGAILLLFGLVVVGRTISSVIDWSDDRYLVTSSRVIHIERRVFFTKRWDESLLTKIQDIAVESVSWLERQLDYGDVRIQTAGSQPIVFVGARQASQLQEAIETERRKAQQRHQASDLRRIQALLAQKMGWAIPDRAIGEPAAPDTAPMGQPAVPARKSRLARLAIYLWPWTCRVEGHTITWRKHWLVLLSKAGPSLLLALISLAALLTVLLRIGPLGQLGRWLEPNSWLAWALPAVAFVISLIRSIYRYDEWQGDVYIVTDNEIIDVAATALRLRGVRRISGSLDNVQNISVSIPNLWHYLVKLGDVVIETAGTQQTFTFNSVYNPKGVQQVISQRLKAFRERREQERRESEERRMVTWLSEFYRMLPGAAPPSGVVPPPGTPAMSGGSRP